MAFFGLKYNMLTYTEILISIGLSIDYMSHSGYSFVVEEGTSLQRSEKALGAMGIALTNAALSSIVGFMFLSFTSVYAFKTCFISFITLFVLSFVYGVIFLPTLLSFVGGSKHKSSVIICDDNEDMNDLYAFGTIGNSKKQERHFLTDFIRFTRAKNVEPKNGKVKLENEHSDEDFDPLLDCDDEIEIISSIS
ncbi:patched domain-containing protein 3-like [Convolutriloba macropyga]|uniref:patched domain-containing protein 3-like n=1 Tax=Convolutriloba macropyga TaxID=536237 RepID=UPI003F523639